CFGAPALARRVFVTSDVPHPIPSSPASWPSARRMWATPCTRVTLSVAEISSDAPACCQSRPYATKNPACALLSSAPPLAKVPVSAWVTRKSASLAIPAGRLVPAPLVRREATTCPVSLLGGGSHGLLSGSNRTSKAPAGFPRHPTMNTRRRLWGTPKN